MTPQESHLISAAAEHVKSLAPEHLRVGMRAVVIAMRDAKRVGWALVRHHRVMPRRQTGRKRERLGRTRRVSDRLVQVHEYTLNEKDHAAAYAARAVPAIGGAARRVRSIGLRFSRYLDKGNFRATASTNRLRAARIADSG